MGWWSGLLASRGQSSSCAKLEAETKAYLKAGQRCGRGALELQKPEGTGSPRESSKCVVAYGNNLKRSSMPAANSAIMRNKIKYDAELKMALPSRNPAASRADLNVTAISARLSR